MYYNVQYIMIQCPFNVYNNNVQVHYITIPQSWPQYTRMYFRSSNGRVYMTQSKIMDTSLSQSVSKILTAYWSKKTYFRPGARKTEIHSFPTMYIMGGGSFGGNGSK